MGWFSQKDRHQPRVRTKLGTFVFDDPGWRAHADGRDLTIAWVSDELDASAIEPAALLLQDLDSLADRAMKYAKSHGTDVWDCKSNLELESVEITKVLDGKFGLTFGVQGEPDFTVNVEFFNEVPTEVWGAD